MKSRGQRAPFKLGAFFVKGARGLIFGQRDSAGSFPAQRLQADPTNGTLHLEFAKYCLRSKQKALAHAEARTARAVGLHDKACDQIIRDTLFDEEQLREIEHNQYYRYATLADEIKRVSGDAKVSVIDVGGGNGMLAQFIPSMDYCLVEPKVNGISGTALPFDEGRFDFAVSCHVLEHLPLESRIPFLDQLLAVSRQGVILLNPFLVEGTFAEERLRLFIELADAKWAKEHLRCTLPKLSFVEEYASTRGLSCRTVPNASIAISMAMFFAGYFMQKGAFHGELRRLSNFYNKLPTAMLDSPDYPTGYLVTIAK